MEEYSPDPNCKQCSGSGIIWVVCMGESEKDACNCVELKKTDNERS